MFQNSKEAKKAAWFPGGEFGKARRTVRNRTWDAFEFPSSRVFLFPFPPLHPTPPLSARLLPHPILLTPLLLHCSQPQTLAFCIKGANPMNNPVRLSQNKLVGEGSRSKPERLEQRGAQPPPAPPRVISPWSGSTTCLDPDTLPRCLPAWLTWVTNWLSSTSLLLTLSPSVSCSLAPSLLLSTLESKSAQIGKVFLRPASGQLEDDTERTFPHSHPFITSVTFATSAPPKSTWIELFFFLPSFLFVCFCFCWKQKIKSFADSYLNLQLKIFSF